MQDECTDIQRLEGSRFGALQYDPQDLLSAHNAAEKYSKQAAPANNPGCRLDLTRLD